MYDQNTNTRPAATNLNQNTFFKNINISQMFIGIKFDLEIQTRLFISTNS